MKILIIEDEKLLQDELMQQLEAYKEFEVVNCFQTVKESVEWLKHNDDLIDLIFMDIELADGVCFEIFDSVVVKTPIIFLTAYSEYAIRAFKENSIDYLLKPLNPKELEFAIEQFNQSTPKQKIDESFFKNLFVKHGSGTSNRLLISYGDTYRYVQVDDIAYFLSEDKYTRVTTFDGESFLYEESLNLLESKLAIHKFHRPARNLIVNINAIDKASKYFNSRLKLHLKPATDTDIIISRAKVKDFLSWMGKNG
jgi:DNA-binding LytR/AlgR family response regulator